MAGRKEDGEGMKVRESEMENMRRLMDSSDSRKHYLVRKPEPRSTQRGETLTV